MGMKWSKEELKKRLDLAGLTEADDIQTNKTNHLKLVAVEMGLEAEAHRKEAKGLDLSYAGYHAASKNGGGSTDAKIAQAQTNLSAKLRELSEARELLAVALSEGISGVSL